MIRGRLTVVGTSREQGPDGKLRIIQHVRWTPRLWFRIWKRLEALAKNHATKALAALALTEKRPEPPDHPTPRSQGARR